MEIVFCQISNTLINKYHGSISDKYYHGIYQCKNGYYKNEHFFELPLWIAEIAGSLIDSSIKQELHIVTNIENSIKYLSSKNALILFSVLDVNKHFIKDIIKSLPEKMFHIGGYTSFDYFNEFDNVKTYKDIKSFIQYLGIDYSYNLDYALFAGFKTVPRLTLSRGCLNRCKFCTVEKTVNKISDENIFKQIVSYQELDFKLIYLNDKTFSQADNFTMLYDLYDIVKSYNDNFLGFIIQTTCTEIISNFELQNMLNTGIIYAVEIGIESYNDNILYELEKPQNEKSIIQAIDIINYYNVKLIPNIIIGFINENKTTYNKTLNMLKHYKPSLYIVNIYNLVIYEDSRLSSEIDINNDTDFNENSIDKSFYDSKQKANNEYFYDEIFKLAIDTLGNK